jgi:hypothetical protein
LELDQARLPWFLWLGKKATDEAIEAMTGRLAGDSQADRTTAPQGRTGCADSGETTTSEGCGAKVPGPGANSLALADLVMRR